MAIQLLKQPGLVSFSRNPVLFKLQSNARLQSLGKKFICRLQATTPPDGSVINIAYAGLSLDFTFVQVPDSSGYQLHFREAGQTDQQYAETLKADLAGNFYILRDFDLDVYTEYGVYFVRFTAKNVGADYNILITPQYYVGLSYIQAGENEVPNPNFKIYFEVWVQRSIDSVPVRMRDSYIEADATGTANIDLSTTLTDALLADGYDRPNFANAIAQVDSKSSCKFFIRYAEVYGTTQVIRQVKQSDTYVALLGGISNEMLENFAFPGYFISGELLRFMKQEPDEKWLLPTQPEFLTITLFKAALTGLQLKFVLTYADDTTATVYKHSMGDREHFSKLTFPVGYVQNNLNLVSDTKAVVSYTVQVVNGNLEAVSVTKTYFLKYDYLPYARHFVYLSSWGTYDTLVTFGKGSTQYEVATESAAITNDNGFLLADGDIINYSASLNNKETVASGYMEKAQIRQFKDLALSRDQLLYRKKRVYAIAFASNSVKEFKDGDNMRAISFEIGFRFEEVLFTVDDQDDLDIPMFLPLNFREGPSDPGAPDDNLDYRYYRKTEAYNKGEVETIFTDRDEEYQTFKQGLDQRFLNYTELLNGKSPIVHQHDDRYLLKAEMQDILISLGYLPAFFGVYETLEELLADYPLANDGSTATIESEGVVSLAIFRTGEWVVIAGGGSGGGGGPQPSQVFPYSFPQSF